MADLKKNRSWALKDGPARALSNLISKLYFYYFCHREVVHFFNPVSRDSDEEKRGLVRKWMPATCNRFLLRQVDSGDKTKLIGPKRGPHLASPPTFFCGRNRLVAQLLREMAAKRGDEGPNSTQNGPCHPEMAKFQKLSKIGFRHCVLKISSRAIF